jgi:hypothetical protein
MINKTLSVSKKIEVGIPVVSESYKKPTPLIIKQIGDGLLAVCQIGTIIGITQKTPTLAIIFAVAGVVGKFLSNSFSYKNGAVK